MNAILVTLPSGLPLFVIEGFTKKEVTIEYLKAKILQHYEWLYGCGNVVAVYNNNSDFTLKIKGEPGFEYISWTWIKSYKNETE